MDTIQIIAITMGTAWASGINLYATIFILGFLGGNGYVVLPPGLEILTDPLVMTVAGVLYCIEFFADKTPGVDTIWDTIHSFIRIPAGAIIAMAAVADTSPAVELTALLLGGTLAAGSHLTKSSTRILINSSPEPVSNWTASISEDLLVIAGIWTALYHPWLFLVALILFVLFMIWLAPRLWYTCKRLWLRFKSLLTTRSKTDINKLMELPPSDT